MRKSGFNDEKEKTAVTHKTDKWNIDDRGCRSDEETALL